MPDPISAERRWQRYHFELPVRLIVQTAHRTEVVGRGVDINEGGIGVRSHIELAVGDQVEIEMCPSYAGLPLRIKTVVRNRRQNLYGLEFIVADALEREKVALVGQLLRGSADFRSC